MDMMLLGETIADEDSTRHHGFWMPAGGNDGVAAAEVVRVTASSVYEIHLETKSSDQDDSSAASIGSVTVTTAQNYKFDVSNAKDLVRYMVYYAGDTANAMHLQFAQPLWQPN